MLVDKRSITSKCGFCKLCLLRILVLQESCWNEKLHIYCWEFIVTEKYKNSREYASSANNNNRNNINHNIFLNIFGSTCMTIWLYLYACATGLGTFYIFPTPFPLSIASFPPEIPSLRMWPQLTADRSHYSLLCCCCIAFARWHR